ncbi:phosphoglycolate phosphatase [Paracoccus sp. p4-l81]|uniref:phosphoglycolate phosphatase n=1 Tax=unclassified Paracoccus (in: a-proteobacteria) TaxID=2688777 RepID=UPI0035B7E26A
MIVLFDLDGTLIDSAPDIHAASNEIMAAEGFPPLDLATVRSFVGKGVPNLVTRLLAAHGIDDPARAARLVSAFGARYETAVGLTQPYPGVPAALDALRAGGHVLGICTNKPVAPARAVLRHLGLLDHFAVVIGGDSAPERKPDPAPLHLAHQACGGGPAVFVGDSEVDAECADRAGMDLLLFTGGYRKTPVAELPHAAAFDHFDELAGLVGARG